MAKKEKAKMKKSTNKKGISQQILKQIGVSVTAVLIVIAVVVLLQINNMGTTANDTELKLESEAAALQLEKYFAPFERMVEQQAVNTEIKAIMNTTGKGQDITKNIKYSTVFNNMLDTKELDDSNILAVWIGDIDANVLTQSDKFTSGSDFDITSRPWFECTKVGKTVLTDPYVDASTGQKVLSVATPVVNAMGAAVGVSGMDISIEDIMVRMEQYKIGKDGYVMLLSGNGTFIYHPNVDLIDTKIQDLNISQNVITAIENKAAELLDYTVDGEKKFGYITPIGETGFVAISCINSGQYYEAVIVALAMLAAVFILGLIFVLVSVGRISRRIVSPLVELNETAMQLAEGNLDVTLNVTSEDEVGDLGRSIEKTVNRLKEYFN